MNKLKTDKRTQILCCLCEGNSIRATARLVGCSINTVVKLLIDAGRACTKFQDKTLRNLACKRLQVDEVWGFVGAKDSNCKPEKKADGWGSAWVWTALCADSKLLATWFVGPRVPNSAYHLLYDLRERLAAGNNVQVTTDGFAMYLKPMHSAFLGEADYAQLQKYMVPSARRDAIAQRNAWAHVAPLLVATLTRSISTRHTLNGSIQLCA